MTAPSEKRSVRGSSSLPSACSGDMYANVPKVVPLPVSCATSRVFVKASAASRSLVLAMPKSRIFACPRSVMKMFAGFMSPMDDPRSMSGIQGIGQLRAQFQDFVAFEAPLTRQSCLECLSPEQFHHDERLTVVIADFVNRADVGMIQSGGGTGLLLESRNPERIVA